MEVFIVYLWLKLDTLNSMLATLQMLWNVFWLIVFFIATFFGINAAVESGNRYKDEAYRKKHKDTLHNVFLKRIALRWFPGCAILFFLVNVLFSAVPTTSQMSVLVATHYGVQAVKSEAVQEVLDVAQKKVKLWAVDQSRELDKKLKEAASEASAAK